MTLSKLFGALVLSVLLIVLLKEFRVRHSAVFSAAATVFFLVLAIDEMTEALSFLREFSEKGGFQEYFSVLCRALGIGLCTGFLAEFCRDLGEGTLSRAAELCGKGAILALAFPLLRDFLELVLMSLAGVS